MHYGSKLLSDLTSARNLIIFEMHTAFIESYWKFACEYEDEL